MRVDLEISKLTLAWAAYRASELGMSRRRFLNNVIERCRMEQVTKEIPNYLLHNPLTPYECIEELHTQQDELKETYGNK